MPRQCAIPNGGDSQTGNGTGEGIEGQIPKFLRASSMDLRASGVGDALSGSSRPIGAQLKSQDMP